MTGTVFDIGYQHYTGARQGRGRSRLAVYRDGVRTALGLGRGGRAKVLPWLFVGMLSFIALIMALIAGAADRMAGPGAAAEMGLPSHADYYGIASVVMFVFAAVVGPELLCPDRRDGVISLYRVRPLTGTDYIAMRWAAFATVMTGAAWLKQVILFLGLCMGDADPVKYLQAHWLDVPRFLLAGIVMGAYATTLALLVAAFTTRRAYAAVFLVGLFIISTPFTVGVAYGAGGALGAWMAMFNLSSIPVHVNDVIFGEISEVTEGSPANILPAWVRVSWGLAWIAGPGAALWARYRRLAA